MVPIGSPEGTDHERAGHDVAPQVRGKGQQHNATGPEGLVQFVD
jgi:hypothetical protein